MTHWVSVKHQCGEVSVIKRIPDSEPKYFPHWFVTSKSIAVRLSVAVSTRGEDMRGNI